MINYNLNNLKKDAREGQNQYKYKFFENMKKYNCALLYGSSSRYAFDTYQAEFNQYDITAIYQANEWY